jgi:polyisoprenoid-binding protein YceI
LLKGPTLKKNLLLFLITSLFSGIFAFDVSVNWTAFKTPSKVGVNGSFDEVIKISDSKNLQDLKIKILTNSVNTNHIARDLTLVESFFKIQNVDKICAKIKNITQDFLTIELKMNQIQHEVKLKISKNNNELLIASGSIDLQDFDMLPSLKAINNSCFELHSGVTWQDVEIQVNIKK